MEDASRSPQSADAKEDYQHIYSLSDMPPEILATICDSLCELRDIDISVSKRDRPVNPQLRYRFSDPFKELRPLLLTHRLLRDVAEAWVGRNVRFFADSAHFQHLSSAFGSRNCFLIRHLRFELDENTAVLAEENWPRLFETLTNQLPNLVELVVWTCSDSGRLIDHPYRPRPAHALEHRASADDMRVAIWKFASFLTLRHPNLKRAMITMDGSRVDGTVADSVVSRVIMHDSVWVMKLNNDTLVGVGPTGTSDESKRETPVHALDAALIRRIKWDVIARSPVSLFCLSNEHQISVDTLSYPRSIYHSYVDQRSFTTENHHDRQGWPKRTNDELIQLCEEYTSRLDLTSDQYLKLFLEDAEKMTKEKVALEKKLQETRSELSAMDENHGSLQRRYNWVVEECNHATNTLREHMGRSQEDRMAHRLAGFAGFGRFGVDDWYRGTRARRW